MVKMKALAIAVLAFISVILMYCLNIYFQDYMQQFNKFKIIFVRPLTINKKDLRVVVWTPYFGKFNFPKNLTGLGCLYDSCLFTSSRSDLKTTQAVVLHWRDIATNDMPPTDSNVKVVLYNYEAPSHVNWEVLQPLVSRIHYVATYRLDSDITCPYGFVRHRKPSDPEPISITKEDFQTKEGIVYVVSHCKTAGKREDLVESLRGHVPVTIYGGCGSTKECNNITYEQCYQKIAKSFKFYLAFENSFCLDYATEKVFLPLAYGMVPVVYGGGHYKRILPPNSYINALDFQTTEHLANHVKLVSANFTLYQRYHEWRKDFVVVHSTPQFYWLCDLCRKLHEDDDNISTRNRNEFRRWWYDQAKCSEYSRLSHKVILKKR